MRPHISWNKCSVMVLATMMLYTVLHRKLLVGSRHIYSRESIWLNWWFLYQFICLFLNLSVYWWHIRMKKWIKKKNVWLILTSRNALRSEWEAFCECILVLNYSEFKLTTLNFHYKNMHSNTLFQKIKWKMKNYILIKDILGFLNTNPSEGQKYR